jgi:hypothetical protein
MDNEEVGPGGVVIPVWVPLTTYYALRPVVETLANRWRKTVNVADGQPSDLYVAEVERIAWGAILTSVARDGLEVTADPPSPRSGKFNWPTGPFLNPVFLGEEDVTPRRRRRQAVR